MVHNKHQLLVRAVCSHRSFSVFVFFFFTLIYCSIFIWALLYVKSTSVSAPNQPEVKSKAIIIRRKRKKIQTQKQKQTLEQSTKSFCNQKWDFDVYKHGCIGYIVLKNRKSSPKIQCEPTEKQKKKSNWMTNDVWRARSKQLKDAEMWNSSNVAIENGLFSNGFK